MTPATPWAYCDVCFYLNPLCHMWAEISRFGHWNVQRCWGCCQLDAHPLADLEALIFGDGVWIPTWLLYEMTYIQSSRSLGGTYVSVEELTK